MTNSELHNKIIAAIDYAVKEEFARVEGGITDSDQRIVSLYRNEEDTEPAVVLEIHNV